MAFSLCLELAPNCERNWKSNCPARSTPFHHFLSSCFNLRTHLKGARRFLPDDLGVNRNRGGPPSL
jgi:hypothetical protein